MYRIADVLKNRPCGIFVTLRKSFGPVMLMGRFLFGLSPREHGGVRMGAETILLIVILTFAAGYVLYRWDTSHDRSRTNRSRKE